MVRKGPLRFLAGTKDDPSVHLRLVEEVLLRASEGMPEASQAVALDTEDLSGDLMVASSGVVGKGPNHQNHGRRWNGTPMES